MQAQFSVTPILPLYFDDLQKLVERFEPMTRRAMLVLVVALLHSTTATAQDADSAACVVNEFSARIEVERYFKGYGYDGMLAECQLAKANRSYVEAYIGAHSEAFSENLKEISDQCSVSRKEAATLSLAYAGGMRRAGGMAIWRLIDEDDKAYTCAAILHIVKNKME